MDYNKLNKAELIEMILSLTSDKKVAYKAYFKASDKNDELTVCNLGLLESALKNLENNIKLNEQIDVLTESNRKLNEYNNYAFDNSIKDDSIIAELTKEVDHKDENMMDIYWELNILKISLDNKDRVIKCLNKSINKATKALKYSNDEGKRIEHLLSVANLSADQLIIQAQSLKKQIK